MSKQGDRTVPPVESQCIGPTTHSRTEHSRLLPLPSMLTDRTTPVPWSIPAHVFPKHTDVSPSLQTRWEIGFFHLRTLILNSSQQTDSCRRVFLFHYENGMQEGFSVFFSQGQTKILMLLGASQMIERSQLTKADREETGQACLGKRDTTHPAKWVCFPRFPLLKKSFMLKYQEIAQMYYSDQSN